MNSLVVIKPVKNHYEGYTCTGKFLFSADTAKEADQEANKYIEERWAIQ